MRCADVDGSCCPQRIRHGYTQNYHIKQGLTFFCKPPCLSICNIYVFKFQDVITLWYMIISWCARGRGIRSWLRMWCQVDISSASLLIILVWNHASRTAELWLLVLHLWEYTYIHISPFIQGNHIGFLIEILFWSSIRRRFLMTTRGYSKRTQCCMVFSILLFIRAQMRNLSGHPKFSTNGWNKIDQWPMVSFSISEPSVKISPSSGGRWKKGKCLPSFWACFLPNLSHHFWKTTFFFWEIVPCPKQRLNKKVIHKKA